MFNEANIEMKIDHNVIEVLALTFRELREGITYENIKVDNTIISYEYSRSSISVFPNCY